MWSLKVSAVAKSALNNEFSAAVSADENTPAGGLVENAASLLIVELPDEPPEGQQFFAQTSGLLRDDGTFDITIRVGTEHKE